MLLGGYRFNLNNRTTGSKRRWTCSRNGARVCKAFVTTINSKIVALHNVHTHAQARSNAACGLKPATSRLDLSNSSKRLPYDTDYSRVPYLRDRSPPSFDYRSPPRPNGFGSQSMYLSSQPLARSLITVPAPSQTDLFRA